MDRPRREGRLGHEPDGRTRLDQVGEVYGRVRGDQYHRRRRRRRCPVQLLGDVEAALAAEVEIDQRHVRTQFVEAPQRLSARRSATPTTVKP